MYALLIPFLIPKTQLKLNQSLFYQGETVTVTVSVKLPAMALPYWVGVTVPVTVMV